MVSSSGMSVKIEATKVNLNLISISLQLGKSLIFSKPLSKLILVQLLTHHSDKTLLMH